MAQSSTSFSKGNKGKPKGTKHTTTLIKEKLGLSTWETMGEWLMNEGLDRYKLEMESLSGKDFIFAHNTLVEYFKPKLNRTTLDGGLNLQHTQIDIEL
jgi:hypothetical protein